MAANEKITIEPYSGTEGDNSKDCNRSVQNPRILRTAIVIPTITLLCSSACRTAEKYPPLTLKEKHPYGN